MSLSKRIRKGVRSILAAGVVAASLGVGSPSLKADDVSDLGLGTYTPDRKTVDSFDPANYPAWLRMPNTNVDGGYVGRDNARDKAKYEAKYKMKLDEELDSYIESWTGVPKYFSGGVTITDRNRKAQMDNRRAMVGNFLKATASKTLSDNGDVHGVRRIQGISEREAALLVIGFSQETPSPAVAFQLPNVANWASRLSPIASGIIYQNHGSLLMGVVPAAGGAGGADYEVEATPVAPSAPVAPSRSPQPMQSLEEIQAQGRVEGARVVTREKSKASEELGALKNDVAALEGGNVKKTAASNVEDVKKAAAEFYKAYVAHAAKYGKPESIAMSTIRNELGMKLRGVDRNLSTSIINPKGVSNRDVLALYFVLGDTKQAGIRISEDSAKILTGEATRLSTEVYPSLKGAVQKGLNGASTDVGIDLD